MDASPRWIIIILWYTAVISGSSPPWNGLRVTWSANPFNSWAFDSLPRDVNASSKNDFKFRDDQCKIPNSSFLGQRYWYKEDPALTLLYDVNGVIAGIQTSIPKSLFIPSNYLINRQYIEDGLFWTLTAYFVDPSIICHGGRTKDLLKMEGTGTGLWLQNRANPLTDTTQIPLTEVEVKKTNWKFGHCFYTMGNHYWYNVTKDMSCDHFVPYCLMYNQGKLTAFCFSINAVLASSRYEHPTSNVADKFIDPVPGCFFTDPTFKTASTIHVYFIDSPTTASWC